MYGTGAETYNHMLKELKSVGCPDWVTRSISPLPGSIYCIICDLDMGPDNVAAIKSVKAFIEHKPWVMVFVNWCFEHQHHLIVESVYKLLDSWTWSALFEPLGVSYFSGVKICCNTWRSSGTPRRLTAQVRKDFGDAAVKKYVPRIPSRPMKGRWGTGALRH